MSAVLPKLASEPEYFESEAPEIVRDHPRTVSEVREPTLLGRILTTSVAAHLLLIGILGAGLPTNSAKPKRPAPPPTPATLVEDVKLQEELPPELPKPADQSQVTSAPDIPAAAQIDLPPISQVETISAVPASVPVAFGLEVKGRVRLVGDASQASGALGGRVLAEPVTIDGNSSQKDNLILSRVVYPREALLHHQQGTVILEFHTSVTGGIYDVKVHTTSGFPVLDQAASDNLAGGRWLGAEGFYLKAYEFQLN